MEKLEYLILDYITGGGPATFASLHQYCKLKYSPDLDDYKIAAAITFLIRTRQICLYDDGTFCIDNS
jgi:hypothetical protein